MKNVVKFHEALKLVRAENPDLFIESCHGGPRMVNELTLLACDSQWLRDSGKSGMIESRLAKGCRKKGLDYALTGFSAAARLAPAVRYQRTMSYVNEPSEELVRELGLKRVSSGPNVSFLIPYDEGVFYAAQEARGVRMVSAVQAYLDLRGFRGRGEEAAEFLLERIMRPQWRGVRTTRKRR